MLYVIFGYVLAILLAVKIIFKLTNGVCRSNTCLVGKTALITGGNSGIGFETALGLAARGCRVIIASRTSSDRQVDDIFKATGNANVLAKRLDLASLASVRAFAADLLAEEERLDILVNNSGAAGLGNVFSADGLQTVMQINHFGPFLLTHLLIPLLKKTPGSRILFTSSMLSFTNNLDDLENLNRPYKDRNVEIDKLTDFRIYSNSKLCNIISARYFAKKLRGEGITSNSLHPGVVHTPIYGHAFSKHVPQFCTAIFYSLLGFLLKDPFEGAQTTLHVALSRDLDQVSGKFFWDCISFIMPRAARNPDLCQKVINESIRLVKLTNEEML